MAVLGIRIDVSSFVRSILNTIHPQPIESNPTFLEAEQFREGIEPVEGVDYDWALDYAKSNYDRLYVVGKELEDKANDVIKYLGGGTGLFTLAALANVTHERVPILAWAIPSFVVAMIAIGFAALVRQPNVIYVPPSAKAAFRYAGYYPQDSNKAKGAFLGQWHQASKGLELANELKADRVMYATWAFVLAIGLLILPAIKALAS